MGAETQEPPFSIVLFLSIMAWCLTHYVDRNVDSPLVEFKEDFKTDDYYLVRLSNLSFSTQIESMKLVFRCSEASSGACRFRQTVQKKVFPSDEADEITVGDPADSVTFEVGQLLPGTVRELRVKYTGSDHPSFYVKSMNPGMRLKEAGLSTMIVKYDGIVTMIICLLAGIPVARYSAATVLGMRGNHHENRIQSGASVSADFGKSTASAEPPRHATEDKNKERQE